MKYAKNLFKTVGLRPEEIHEEPLLRLELRPGAIHEELL
jgi:hypothetical protein